MAGGVLLTLPRVETLRETQAQIVAAEEDAGRVLVEKRSRANRFAAMSPAVRTDAGIELKKLTLDCSAEFPERPDRTWDSVAAKNSLDYGAHERFLNSLPLDYLLTKATDQEVGWQALRRLHGMTVEQCNPLEKRLRLFARLDLEVTRGGFNHFFWERTADEIPELRVILDEVGMTRTAEILDCALTAFPGATPGGVVVDRIAELNAYGASRKNLFDDLDEAYRSHHTDQMLELGRYVRAHAAELSLPPRDTR